MVFGRFAQWFISLSFLTMLGVPHLAEFPGKGTSAESVEKRTMARMPDTGLILRSFSDYTTQFDRYYNDSFGMRNRLIRWNNQLRLLVFNESPVKGVRVGREGWLFYANEWVLEDYENVMPYKSQELARIGRIFEERRLWLERRGIQLFILVVPNKHTIYSEYLPSAIHKIGKESRFDQVADYFKHHPEIEFVDVREALFRAKPIQRLYHRTDTHWNDYGAFVGYRELMERIANHFPAARKLSLDDYDVSIADGAGGDLAGMLSLNDVIKEERITLVPKFTPKATDGTRPYPDPVDAAKELGREMVVKETRDPGLPKALVFRDSFSWPLIPFLAESLQSVVFVWTFDFLPELIEREKPDLVILECVERYINCLTMENPAEMKAEFPSAGLTSVDAT